MTVLLIGARGFVGMNLKMYLEGQGHRVIPFEGDILSTEDTFSILAVKFDALINLAAYGNNSGHDQTGTLPYTTNISGMLNVLTIFCLMDRPKVFINAGSSSEYGLSDTPMSVGSPLLGKTPYAKSKIMASQILGDMVQEGKRFHTLRLFSVYGPHEAHNRLIPTAFRSAFAGVEMPLAPGVHDFVYIDDVCKAFERILNDEKSPKISHAASGIQHTNQEVVSIVEEIVGAKIKTKPVESLRPFDTTKYWVSDEKSILVKPTYSLKEGLEKTWQYRHR